MGILAVAVCLYKTMGDYRLQVHTHETRAFTGCETVENQGEYMNEHPIVQTEEFCEKNNFPNSSKEGSLKSIYEHAQ